MIDSKVSVVICLVKVEVLEYLLLKKLKFKRIDVNSLPSRDIT